MRRPELGTRTCLWWAIAALAFGGCTPDKRPRAPVSTSPMPPPLDDAQADARDEDSAVGQSPVPLPPVEMVTLRLTVQPRGSKGSVFWGRKRLAVFAPGTPDVIEIERPQASGPLDLVIKADGYLDYATRLFTDRPDALTVRLVRPDEARGLLGYQSGMGGRAGHIVAPAGQAAPPGARH